jgi:hypothetical protein
MKTIDLKKLETALVLATTRFWRGKPPRFTLSRRDDRIEIVLHSRAEPIKVIEVREAEFADRTESLVLRCAQKMAGAWTDWATEQLGAYDLEHALSTIPYENIARSFPVIQANLADIFES